ncbi:MAG: sulfurtransferase [Planctomycetaceae bacterium]
MPTALSQTSAVESSSPAFVNISAYKFVALNDLERRRADLRIVADRLKLKGTVLLSPEGINLFVAGPRKAIDEFVDHIRSDTMLADLQTKESLSRHQPFNRMLIKLKREIIAFGVPTVNPIEGTSPKLPPSELKRWLDEGRRVHLLDTRNDYEIEIGTFENAIPAGVDNFRDFPEAVERLPQEMKNEPVVMFCTGGIRCEKAGPFMEQAGFKHIFQLEGGILKYFEECGGDHYDGDCFVFDQRVAVDPNLQETDYGLCYVCQEVVSPEDQQSEKYVPGESCPRCYREPDEQLQERLAQRNQQLRQIADPLPGSQPYFNRRPLNVPERFTGQSLIDFLCSWHPQVSRDVWLEKIAASQIVPGPRYGRRKRRKKSAEESLPLSPDRPVRGGERFEHLLPGTVEPDVDPSVEILFEDRDFIVVNKPAPLPLHPSGRFHRNTLHFILNELYRPERPLLVHRLDANTSGVLVLCRRRAVAKIIQPQFEQRAVRKTYLARVIGHPPDDAFECAAAVSDSPSDNGIRTIDPTNGLAAVTRFKVLHRFSDGTSLLEVTPETGRTNQIRIHLWHLGFPIVGDPTYLPASGLGENITLNVGSPPMCLHASAISLHDPTGNQRQFRAADPAWAAHDALRQPE